jgi:hypothetical protein
VWLFLVDKFLYLEQSLAEVLSACWDCADKTPTIDHCFDTGQMPAGQVCIDTQNLSQTLDRQNI